MPNILFVTHYHPGRADLGGGGVRTRLLWEVVKSIGDVYVVMPGERTERVDDCCATFHASHGYLGNMFEGRLWRLTGRICNLVVNPCYTPMPLNTWFPGIHFDVAVGRYFYAFNDVRPWKNGIPTLVDIDDHPLEKLETASLQGHVSWQSNMAMTLELAYLGYATRGGWIVKEEDRRHLGRKETCYDVLANIPPEVPKNYNPFQTERKMVLLTVALLSYPPNYQGISDFLETIWPSVKSAFPTLEYWVVGGGLPDELKRAWENIPGVRLMGFVEDLSPYYEQALAVVVPVNQGAGSCIKTIESLSRGRIALSTMCGARGYRAYSMQLDGEEVNDGHKPILCYDSPSAFLRGLNDYVLDVEIRQNCEETALQIVKEHYTFEKFSRIIYTTTERLVF